MPIHINDVVNSDRKTDEPKGGRQGRNSDRKPDEWWRVGVVGGRTVRRTTGSGGAW